MAGIVSGRGGPVFLGPPFPEFLVKSAEDATAQYQDGVGSILGPGYAGLSQAPADHGLAAALDHPGSDLQAPRARNSLVAHARAVELAVSGALGP